MTGINVEKSGLRDLEERDEIKRGTVVVNYC